MKSFSVIIPSANPANLIPCVQAVRRHESGLAPEKIIVIDDGARSTAEAVLPGVKWIAGVKPFIFARNCNLGIVAAGDDDVILLNDDALLQVRGGFSAMAQASSGWGTVSASTNGGNSSQKPVIGSTEVREVRTHCTSFICVYIPRETINGVGFLDERFDGYGWEDNDYLRRVRSAGMKVGVLDACYVDHGKLTSTFRGPGKCPDTRRAYKHYEMKWGRGAQ